MQKSKGRSFMHAYLFTFVGIITPQIIMSSKEEAANCVRKALRRIVMVSSVRQAVSGVLAAGGVNAARYLGKKISKAWTSRTSWFVTWRCILKCIRFGLGMNSEAMTSHFSFPFCFFIPGLTCDRGRNRREHSQFCVWFYIAWSILLMAVNEMADRFSDYWDTGLNWGVVWYSEEGLLRHPLTGYCYRWFGYA